MASGEFFSLAGKVAIVTGGAQGIGEAICRRLAAAGAKVAVFDLAKDTAGAVASSIGGLAVVGDVASEEDIIRVGKETEAGLGPIDIVVNNAGITGGSAATWDVNRDTFAKVLDINVIGPFLLCKHTVGGMIERKFGRVINIASVAGLVPLRLQSPFVAAKAGVINLTRSMAIELGSSGVLVNAIAPGSILTDGTRQLFYGEDGKFKASTQQLLDHIPVGRPGTPEEVAHAALFLAAPESTYINGHVLTVDGGWTAGYMRDF